MFTEHEIGMLNDALNMAMQSNKRMQTSKPQYTDIFNKIEQELNQLKIKINTKETPAAKK